MVIDPPRMKEPSQKSSHRVIWYMVQGHGQAVVSSGDWVSRSRAARGLLDGRVRGRLVYHDTTGTADPAVDETLTLFPVSHAARKMISTFSCE